jgi:glyoxylase-like metal-dependent hydrolase (beta-lactamase superfamily II)
MHELELRHVLDDRSRDLAVPREMFPALQDSGRLRVLSGEGGMVEGLRWVHTPGHTPGLISLFLQYGGERWVLASDAVKSRHELVTGIASMTEDYAASSASIAKIRQYADRVMPGHGGLLRLERVNGEVLVHTAATTGAEVTVYPSGDPRAARVISLEG